MTNLVDQSQRALGSDLNVGPLGYGCWRLVNMPVAEAQARVEHVLAPVSYTHLRAHET